MAEMADLIRRTATNLGIDPSDLGTAISYETGGTFNPNLWGGKGGNYLGLIQFGPEERKKYGVAPDMPMDAHFGAIENFLRDRGVKPGMGMLDIYSTINAGSPGRYNASDANNGGMPGTVADKVATQMYAHRQKANSMLGVDPSQASSAPQYQPAGAAAPAPAPQAAPPISFRVADQPTDITPQAQATPAPAAGGADGGFDYGKLLAAVAKVGGGQQQQQQEEDRPVPITPPQPQGLAAARQLAMIMQRLGGQG